MTNAVDVMCVGGAKHETVVCFNKSAGFPLTHEFQGVGSEPNLVYTRRAWWEWMSARWFWIATTEGEEPSDGEIYLAVTLNEFPPAWDMRDKPAPEFEPEA